MFPSRRRGFGVGRHPGGGNFALFLLLTQMVQFGFDRIPPVTLVSILGQVALFLHLVPRKVRLPSIQNVCISTVSVLEHHDYKRLILASFFHVDEWHLYYNMISMLWKGSKLEPKLGSGYFCYLILVFAILTNILTMGLGFVAQELTGDPLYAYKCSVGFSGVLFGLKVLMTHWMPGTHYVLGMFPLPGKYICWAELILIQVITPNVSFLGHLSGILVGLLYIKGPLKSMMDVFVPAAQTSHQNRPRRAEPSYTYASGTPRGSRQNYGETTYTGGQSEEEQMQHAMRESLRNRERSSPYGASETRGYREPTAPTLPPEREPPSYNEVTQPRTRHLYPDISNLNSQSQSNNDINEEIRRKRLERFT